MGVIERIKAAAKQSAKHPVRSLLTVLGIVIGIAVMTAVLSVGEAAQERVKTELIKFGINRILIYPDEFSKLDRGNIERIRSDVRGVSRVTGQAFWRGRVKGDKGSVSAQVTGTMQGLEAADNKVIMEGRFITERDDTYARRVAVLSESCAEELFGGEAVGQRLSIRGLDFEIVGVEADTKKLYKAVVNHQIFIPASAFEDVFGGGFDEISFVMDGEGDMSGTVERATESIYETYDGTLSVIDMSEQMKYADDILGIIRLVLGAIAVMSLIVGGIGIMNIMLVTVSERKREIGLKKALGAKNSDILKQFLTEAVLYAAAGAVVGAALGTAGTLAAEKMIGLAEAVSPVSLAAAAGFSAVIGVGAGLLPAVRAARLDPVEALRD